jgi:hypothetical protein
VEGAAGENGAGVPAVSAFDSGRAAAPDDGARVLDNGRAVCERGTGRWAKSLPPTRLAERVKEARCHRRPMMQMLFNFPLPGLTTTTTTPCSFLHSHALRWESFTSQHTYPRLTYSTTPINVLQHLVAICRRGRRAVHDLQNHMSTTRVQGHAPPAAPRIPARQFAMGVTRR